MGIADT